MFKFPILVAFLIFSTSSSAQTSVDTPAAARVNTSDFTRYAEFETVSISPKGTYLAITQRKDNLERLIVLERETLKPKFSTNFGEEISVSNLMWASEKYILVQPARQFPAITDYKVSTGEIGTINVETGRSELIFGYRAGNKQTGTHIRQARNTYSAAIILDVLPNKPHDVLIQTLGYGTEGTYNELLQLDIRNGRTIKLAKSPVRNGRFAPETKRQSTLVAGQNSEGIYEVHLHDNVGQKYKKVYEAKLLSGTRWPISPEYKSGYYLFSDSTLGKKRGLVSWNPETNDLQEIFRHDEVDYSSSLRTPQHELWGIRYHNPLPKFSYPDPSHPLAKVHNRLVKNFPNLDIQILNMTDDHSLGVIFVSGPTHAGSFIIVDLVNFKFLAKLDSRPWFNETTLAEIVPLEFKSRDGLKIRGLLTLPPGQEKDLPTIVMVHGGPHGVYDRWGFNWRAQLLAANGFAVLQINYRGSSGRGLEFQAKGFGRWGREMQDDVTDGVRFAIQEGITNPNKVCIYGESYGAYSALTGAFLDPDLYQCAVGVAGVYDLKLLFKAGDIRRTLRGVNYLKTAVGENEEDLISRSPSHNADKIDIPVLLVHGKKDLRAPIKHAERMRKALIKAKNAPQWHVEKREGHGISSEENRIVVYDKMLKFFKTHIGTDNPGTKTKLTPLEDVLI